jgi:hypothetical protein
VAGFEFVKMYRNERLYRMKRFAELRILLWIADQMGYDNCVVTQYQILANAVEIKRRYAITCVMNLEKAGWIETRPQIGSHVAIWLKRGFGFKTLTDISTPPPNWSVQETIEGVIK